MTTEHVFDSMDEWNSRLLAIPVPDFCQLCTMFFIITSLAALLTLLKGNYFPLNMIKIAWDERRKDEVWVRKQYEPDWACIEPGEQERWTRILKTERRIHTKQFELT